MTCQRRHRTPIYSWFRKGLKVAAWALVLYFIATGLQACKTQPTSKSKFDTPKHDHLEKRHRRWN